MVLAVAAVRGMNRLHFGVAPPGLVILAALYPPFRLTAKPLRPALREWAKLWSRLTALKSCRGAQPFAVGRHPCSTNHSVRNCIGQKTVKDSLYSSLERLN